VEQEAINDPSRTRVPPEHRGVDLRAFERDKRLARLPDPKEDQAFAWMVSAQLGG
jgi:hypothetical protein